MHTPITQCSLLPPSIAPQLINTTFLRQNIKPTIKTTGTISHILPLKNCVGEVANIIPLKSSGVISVNALYQELNIKKAKNKTPIFRRDGNDLKMELGNKFLKGSIKDGSFDSFAVIL
jgi:hypothetical protein